MVTTTNREETLHMTEIEILIVSHEIVSHTYEILHHKHVSGLSVCLSHSRECDM